MHLEFAIQALDVIVDRLHADPKPLGDFLVGIAFSQPRQNLQFALG